MRVDQSVITQARAISGARFSDDDLGRIEAEMRAIMAEDQPFVRHEHGLGEGLELFADQPFKREIIEAVGSGADEVDAGGTVVSTCWNSDSFTDLCRGPHVPSTGRLGHFKLMRVAGAYWRGDEKRAQLQRFPHAADAQMAYRVPLLGVS